MTTLATSVSDLGTDLPGIRDIIREVVREELCKMLPTADRPSSLSLTEVVREGVHRAFKPEVPINMTTPEEPTLSYAAMARRPPQENTKPRRHPDETLRCRSVLDDRKE